MSEMSEVWATESLLQSSLYPEVHTSPLLVSCTPASLLLHLEEEGGDPEPDVEERRDERIAGDEAREGNGSHEEVCQHEPSACHKGAEADSLAKGAIISRP